MAKKFIDYTVEDLYRNGFSFLIRGIKDKELEETGLSEEVFIRAQKLALMNIFTCLNANEIDTNTQVIGPFLNGKRLITDINEISAKVEEIKALPVISRPDTSFSLSDKLATQYSKCNGVIKFGGVDRHKLIESAKHNMANYNDNISAKQRDILDYSRRLLEQQRIINEQLSLLATDALNQDININRFSQFIHELQKNDFHVIKIERGTDRIFVSTLRICKMFAINPDNNREMKMPLLVPVSFSLYSNEIKVTTSSDAISYSLRKANTYMHPHISESGSFCLGNTSGLLSRMMQQGVYSNLPDFVKIYADLLDSYNSGSPYAILQIVFMNSVSGLLSMAEHSRNLRNMKLVDFQREFIDYPTFESLPPHSELRSAIEYRADNVRISMNNNYDSSSISEVIFQFYKEIRNTLTEETIHFIENSNIRNSVSFNSYTFKDSSLKNLSGFSKAIAILRQFINDTEIQGEQNEEESNYSEEETEE